MIKPAVQTNAQAFWATLSVSSLVLVGCAVGIAFSVWYLIDRFRLGPRNSRWVLGWNGGLYRRKSQECSNKHESNGDGTVAKTSTTASTLPQR
jgi:hypothetical protein